jgi:hypothetical protein
MPSALAACRSLTLFACGAPEQPKYGIPNEILGREPPPAEAETAGDAGTVTVAECVEANFKTDQSATCAVKWSVDLFPKMQTAPWACSTAGCHGGDTTPPKFTTDTAKGTWDALRKWKGGAGKNYINPCSKDPAASFIVGNFKGLEGKQQMPTSGASAEDIAKLETWVKCGSPLN